MKTICLYFEIHQITHLKRYRFFDIGTDHYYYDDYENERTINDIAEKSYMPALETLHKMIKENGKFFKVAFSLSGVGIEQLEMHAPQVLDKLQQLNETGCVEFLAEPYSHGLSSLANEECFVEEVKKSPEVFLLIGRETTESVEIPEEVKPVLEEFRDVFPEELPTELPPLRDIQHQIDLVP